MSCAALAFVLYYSDTYMYFFPASTFRHPILHHHSHCLSLVSDLALRLAWKPAWEKLLNLVIEKWKSSLAQASVKSEHFCSAFSLDIIWLKCNWHLCAEGMCFQFHRSVSQTPKNVLSNNINIRNNNINNEDLDWLGGGGYNYSLHILDK